MDSHDCLFIGPHLPGRDQFLTDRSQPVWEEQSTGKGRLIKAPDGAFSPNFFDDAGLGICRRDAQHGAGSPCSG